MSLEKGRAILRIKKQREERTGVALRQSMAAFTVAYQDYQQADQTLKAYVSAAQDQKERLYAEILGQAFRPGDIDRLNHQVERIGAQVAELKERVRAAQEGLLKAKAALDKAKADHATERRQVEKWKRLAERAEKTERRREALAAETALDEEVSDRHGRRLVLSQGASGS